MSLFYRWGLRSHDWEAVTAFWIRTQTQALQILSQCSLAHSPFKGQTCGRPDLMILFFFFFFTSGKLLEHLEEMNFLWGVPWALLPEKYNPRAPHLWYPPTGNQCHDGRCPSSQRSLPVLQSWHMHSAAAVLWGRVLSYWGPGLGIWDEALC